MYYEVFFVLFVHSISLGLYWYELGELLMCRIMFSAGWSSEIAGSRRVHRVCATNRWAECQDAVIRTGRAAYLCWRREGVTFSRFASRADVCAANSLAESQGFLGRSVRAAN